MSPGPAGSHSRSLD
jgi:hypothetical protein